MGWLEGKVAVVTGGGSGIGRGVVERFVDQGARVGILEKNESRATELQSVFGQKVCVVEGDAGSQSDNQRLVDVTVGSFGSLDVMVGNVGVWDYGMSLEEMPSEKLSEAFDELFGVNVKAYLFLAKSSLPHLIGSGGTMIFTVSNAGFYPQGGGPLYTASKFAVRGLVTQLAYELAPRRVRVNGVAPGGTVTDIRGLRSLGQESRPLSSLPDVEDVLRRINPLGIVTTPTDHAWAYLYLAVAEHSRAVTGDIIHSDGGIGVRGIGL